MNLLTTIITIQIKLKLQENTKNAFRSSDYDVSEHQRILHDKPQTTQVNGWKPQIIPILKIH